MNARDLDPRRRRAHIRSDRVPAQPRRIRPDRSRPPVRRHVLAPRAAQHDRNATFPIENFRDMHPEGLLGICVPKADGGTRRQLPHLLPGRRRARPLLRRHRAVLEHARLLDAVDRRAGRRSEMTAAERAEHNERRRLHYKRIVGDGAIYSQPFSEGGAAAAGGVALRHRGEAGRWRLPRQRQEDLRLAVGRRRLLRRAVHRTRRGRGRRAAATRSIWRCRPTPRASRWSATGTRSACAARSRARSSSRTCSCPRTRC